MTESSPQPEPPLQSSLAFDPPPPPPPAPPGAGTIWFQRLSLFILVLFCVYLGVFVAAMPWWSRTWDENPFLLAHPRLWAILRLGAVRGIISGFGLIDIWIGISEAIHYRESKSPPAPEE